MYYTLGVLFVLGSLSISSALPPCICTRNLKPVCGSDGQTYSNECMLRCAQVSNSQLFMERNGRCDGLKLGPPRHVREVELNCFCSYEYQPFCGTDGNTYSNRCALNCAKRSAPVEIAHPGECSSEAESSESLLRQVREVELDCFCTYEYQPFCGTDGNTYSNRCALNCAKRSAPVEIAHPGECSSEAESSESLLRQVREVVLDCFCTYEYQPFCGTDGNTYSNRCALNCAKRSAPVEIAHPGECITKRDTVQVAQLPSRCSCPRNLAPVCGSDGHTYDNDCVLDCMSQKRPELRLEHVGSCEDVSCSCSREAIPVCGTDGITYDNQCILKCAKDNDSNLDMAHMGECDNGVKVVDPSTCSCTREGRPVCGTDGNTYGNPCLLNCARDNDQTLHVDYEGPCDNRVKVVEVAENFPCVCTTNYKPVCSSNGVTFANKCVMKCAGTHLTVEKEGPCEE